MIEVGVALICGAPGIGKSSFASSLHSFICNSANSDAAELRHQQQWTPDVECECARVASLLVSYDAIVDTQMEAALINSETNEWKSSRELIFSLVQSLVHYLLHMNNESSSTETNCWPTWIGKESTLSSRLDNAIDSTIINKFSACVESDLQRITSDTSLVVILLDDLFYYESMRLVFYKAAFGAGHLYASLCLMPSSGVDLLLERNACREKDKQLDERIVRNIFAKFEYSHDVAWEKSFSRVIGVVDTDDSPQLSEAAHMRQTLVDICHIYKRFRTFVQASKKRRQLDEQMRLQSSAGLLNLAHKSDLIIRKLISAQLKTHHQTGSDGIDKAQYAQRLNAKRASILNMLKTSAATQPQSENIVDLVSKLNNFFVNNNETALEEELKSMLLLDI